MSLSLRVFDAGKKPRLSKNLVEKMGLEWKSHSELSILVKIFPTKQI